MTPAGTFWLWFDKNRTKFYAIKEVYDQKLYLELQTKLREFHPQLTFQIGGKLDTPIRSLIISANGVITNFGKVEELVNSAPIFQNWDVIAFKPADGFGIKVNVAGIIFDPKKLKFILMVIHILEICFSYYLIQKKHHNYLSFQSKTLIMLMSFYIIDNFMKKL